MSEITILLVDDDRAVHTAVEAYLEPLGARVISTAASAEGLRLALLRRPDVILLDVNLPDMDGFKLCRHLKESAVTRDVPVLFLTVDHEVGHVARALDCGASDYLRKPVHRLELRARVQAALRTKRMIDLLKEQARIDALTGLKNRAAFDDALAAAVSAHDRTAQPFALLMLDLDHFKAVNDTFGHGVGDEVLRQVGTCLRARCRPYDVPCRFGGDEFGVILGDVEGAVAERAAERVLAGIQEISVPAGEKTLSVTASAGFASTEGVAVEGTSLLDAADAALYRAKQKGRARLVIAQAESAVRRARRGSRAPAGRS